MGDEELGGFDGVDDGQDFILWGINENLRPKASPTGTRCGRMARSLAHRQVGGCSLQIPHALVQRTLEKKTREAGVSDERNAGAHNWRLNATKTQTEATHKQ